MRIDIISLLPELIRSPFEASILKRAQTKGLAEVHLHDLREFGLGKHKQVDDYAFGGGAGMVMKPEPLFECIEGLMAQRTYDAVIYTSPDGETLNQPMANRMSAYGNVMIVCGHYKGIDQRVRDTLITHEISIGDYVLSGGELAAAVIADPHSPNSGGSQRRDFGPDRFVSGQLAGATGVHASGRVSGPQSARNPYFGQHSGD